MVDESMIISVMFIANDCIFFWVGFGGSSEYSSSSPSCDGKLSEDDSVHRKFNDRSAANGGVDNGGSE